jgi:chitosanase
MGRDVIVLSDVQIATIDAIVSVFESERPGDYGAIARDPNDAGGLSYGKHQAALTKGTLFRLISRYCALDEAQCGVELKPYLPQMEAGDRKLDDNQILYGVLKKAAGDPTMQKVQDAFFNEQYMAPALKKWQELGFTKALSAAVIYDSFIHSGKLNMQARTEASFGKPTPETEQAWIKGYIATRKQWLTDNYPNTAIRMRTFEALAEQGNWDLSLPLNVVRPKKAFPLTAWDLGAHLFSDTIKRVGAVGFGVAKPGEASAANGRDRFVQNCLASLGYLPKSACDGVFGAGTSTALKQFQKDQKLPQTGVCDAKAFDKLCEELEEKGGTRDPAAEPKTAGLKPLPAEEKSKSAGALAGAGAGAGAGAVGVGVGGAVLAGKTTGDTTATADTAATEEAATAAAPPAATETAAPTPESATAAAPGAAAPPPAATEASVPAPTTPVETPASVPAQPPAATPAPPVGDVATTTASVGAPEPTVNLGIAKVPVGIFTLGAAGLFLVAVVLVSMARRKSY